MFWLCAALLLGCGNAIADGEDTGGSGDNDGTEDTDPVDSEDTDTDTDVGPQLEVKASLQRTGQMVTNGGHVTLALVVGDWSSATLCAAGTEVMELGDSVEIQRVAASNVTFTVTAEDEPELLTFLDCINNGTDDPAGYLQRMPDFDGTGWSSDQTETSLGFDALIGQDITELHVVHQDINPQNVGSILVNYDIRFDFMGPPAP